MKLYFSPAACSLADHIALIESGLKFETDKVDLKTKTLASGGDYEAINPKGYVPALELDEGGILTENIAILSYIADRSDTLRSEGELARYRLLEALAYISTELHKGFAPFFMPDSREEERAAARATIGKRLALFEKTLANNDYLLGKLSVADCYLFVMLFWAKTKTGVDVPPNLSRYYDRLSARDAFAQALADEGLC